MDFVRVRNNKGYDEKHILIRSKNMNNDINPALSQFREKQHASSIDTLTNQLKAMELDLKQTEDSLKKKADECNITKDVLRMKLEDTLSTLHTEEDNLRMSPTMLSADDLSNLGIEAHIDEPVRKVSREDT